MLPRLSGSDHVCGPRRRSAGDGTDRQMTYKGRGSPMEPTTEVKAEVSGCLWFRASTRIVASWQEMFLTKKGINGHCIHQTRRNNTKPIAFHYYQTRPCVLSLGTGVVEEKQPFLANFAHFGWLCAVWSMELWKGAGMEDERKDR